MPELLFVFEDCLLDFGSERGPLILSDAVILDLYEIEGVVRRDLWTESSYMPAGY